jgi:catechol 2,3-dioxygenase-like lactoylglutathione lyase family enzyme
MRIRQVVVVAKDLEAARADLVEVFGLAESHRDVADYGGLGITNVVMPVGTDFLEIVAPLRRDSAAGRYLDLAGGEGGYMVIVQYDDFDAAAERARQAGARFVYKEEFVDQRQWHIHPKDVGGAIVALDWADPPSGWRWAGENWQTEVRDDDLLNGIRGIEMSSPSPELLASRWQTVLGGSLTLDGPRPSLMLGDSRVGFVRWSRPFDRLTGIDLAARQPGVVLQRSAASGLPTGRTWLDLRGIRYNVV